MIRSLGAVLVSFLLVLPLIARAGTSPQYLEVTGRLVDKTGKVHTGSENLRFEVWDSGVGGTRIWTETRKVNVTAGEYKVLLGRMEPIPSLNELSSYRVVVEAPAGTDSIVTLRNLTVRPPEDSSESAPSRTTKLQQELERSRREVAALRERIAGLSKTRSSVPSLEPLAEDGTPLALRDSVSDGSPWSQEAYETPEETLRKTANIKRALEKESRILRKRLDRAMKEAEKKSGKR